MAADPIPVDPHYPLGDAAGLLEYRRTATGMKPIAPARAFGPVGHAYLTITCTLRGAGGGGANGIALRHDPWIPFDEYHPSRAADLITVALSIFGVILALVAAICLLITAWNGWV